MQLFLFYRLSGLNLGLHIWTYIMIKSLHIPEALIWKDRRKYLRGQKTKSPLGFLLYSSWPILQLHEMDSNLSAEIKYWFSNLFV